MPSNSLSPLGARFEWLIAKRFTFSHNNNRFISFISLISMIGMALGVMALIVVLSVMNGFQGEIRDRILSVVPHIQIINYAQRLENWQAIMQRLDGQAHVTSVTPFVHGNAMLSNGQAVKPALLQGINPIYEGNASDFRRKLTEGDLNQLGQFTIALGSTLASQLAVTIGDSVLLITPQSRLTPAGFVPRVKTFKVAAIIHVDMHQYDAALALIHIKDAQKLYNLGNAVSGVRVQIDDVMSAPTIAPTLLEADVDDLFAVDWTQSHRNFFRALKIEKTMMFIILSLIVAVAAFNLVSTLMMMVTEKRSDIAILRTMGAQQGSIVRIFIWQGSIIGLLGLLLGTITGLLVASNMDVIVPVIEHLLGTPILNPEVYNLSTIPSTIVVKDVLLVVGLSILLTLLATLLPSWWTTKIYPAQALRHE